MIRKLYVVQHSHTDIGYTHGQGRILRWHGQYIRQAMTIAERRDDFFWTCETFAPVRHFWLNADDTDRRRFVSLAADGRLGLSAAYFNFTELPDEPLLHSLSNRVRTFSDAHGITLNAAMFADVNGLPLTYARALASVGVRFVLTNIHPHHGYVPFGRRELLFHWDLGDGQSLRVCHADHYTIGNELGLAPGAELDYTARFNDPPKPHDDDVLERRLPVYLRRVESTGWPHDFLVVCVSGLLTDNAPPSAAVADRIARWNQRHGHDVKIELTTLTRLTDIAHQALEIPTFTGDWPDWWADGVASDPQAVALFRHAQRQRRWITAMAATDPQSTVDTEALDDALSLFAEHTFGHSESVRQPWQLLAQQLRIKKLGYAADAADLAEVLFDRVTEPLGAGPLAYDRPPRFAVVNPFDHAIRGLVELEIEGCEMLRWNLANQPLRVVRRGAGAVLHELAPSMRGTKLLVDLIAQPAEKIIFTIEVDENAKPSMPSFPPGLTVPDRMHDIVGDDEDLPPVSIVTDFATITWQAPLGIISWVDASTGKDLIRPGSAMAPFTVLASRMPSESDGARQCKTRRNLGRNRNSDSAVFSTSTLRRASRLPSGPLLDVVELDYQFAGELARLRLSAWRRAPRVDVELILHKSGAWDAENVYLALPLSTGETEQLWIDRGLPIRPGRDQLPGTLIDYYGVQDGLAWCGQTLGVAIAQRDSHLVQLGPLHYGARQLANPPQPAPFTNAFAWLMCSTWETNFAPELSGFYSFRYSVIWGENLTDAAAALALCRDATTDLHAFRLCEAWQELR